MTEPAAGHSQRLQHQDHQCVPCEPVTRRSLDGHQPDPHPPRSARSGIERTTPVACSPRGEGRFAIWAAKGGSPTHPAWYDNLKATPISPSRSGPRRSWSQRRSWTTPAGPSYGRSWPRSSPASLTRHRRGRPCSFRSSCSPSKTDPQEPDLHHRVTRLQAYKRSVACNVHGRRRRQNSKGDGHEG
jgi:hypothetical protein